MKDVLSALLPHSGWLYAAVLFYLVAGWQRLCVLTLTDPDLAASMSYGLRERVWTTRALNIGFVLLWLPLTLAGLVVSWWTAERDSKETQT